MSAGFDIIIVGAGMVGAALANLLEPLGMRVALLDREVTPRFDPRAQPGLRVSAISCGSQRILRAAGAWDEIAGNRVSPYRSMHVWDAASPAPSLQATAQASAAGIHFDCAELGEPQLGHIIENALIQHALAAAAKRRAGVTMLAPVSIEQITLGEDRAEVEFDDGRILHAQLLVGADGAGSRSRALVGIEAGGRDYQQRGVVTNVHCQHWHQQAAWQRFMPDGPLALLPLSDGACSIVWSTTAQHAQELCQLDDAAFASALTDASDGVLGQLRPLSERASFPLRMQYARNYTLRRFALVGDAAHSVHPLAGQGVNLGLSDAAALAQVVQDSLAGQDSPESIAATLGDAACLRRYERWRKGENMAMMAMLDGLDRLFGSSSPLLGWLRRSGLDLVDNAGALKSALARRAMGISGDLPRVQKRA